MYEIRVSDRADKVLRKWKKSNPQLWKKYQKVFYDLYEHPRTGIGHPEALVGGNNIRW